MFINEIIVKVKLNTCNYKFFFLRYLIKTGFLLYLYTWVKKQFAGIAVFVSQFRNINNTFHNH